MKKILKLFLIITLLIPSISYGAFAVGWQATSTTQGWTFPNLVNGVLQTIVGKNFIATGTVASVFPYASTTAISGTTFCISTDCRTAWPTGGGGAGTYPFTPDTNYGVNNQATTGIAWFQNGVNASSTSNFSNASTSILTVTTAYITNLGNLATGFVKVTGGVLSVDTNTYLTGNQSITLSGDVSGTGSTAITTAIGSNKVTVGMLAQAGANTILGNPTGATANIQAFSTSTLFTNASGTKDGLLTSTDWNTFNNKQNTLTVSFPQVLTGSALSFGGLSTSSPSVIGNIPYYSGVNTFANVATTTASCSGSASCTPFTVIGSSPITISATGGSGSIYPFVPATTYNTISSGTSTPLWLQGSPYSLFASSTSIFNYASTTALTAINAYLTKIGNLTGNGFIKTSGSDGTLSIDTTTYLSAVTANAPLSGSGTVGSPLVLSTAGTWSGNAGTATSLAANGTDCSAGSYPLGVDASGNSVNCTVATTGTLTAVTGTFPIASSGGNTPNITFGGLSTSTDISAGANVLYATGVNTIASVATGTVSSSGGVTVTAGRNVLGGALAIGCTVADTGNAGCLSSANWNTFNNKQATIGVTFPVTLSGATVGFGGLSTSSAAVVGNLPYFSGVNTFANIATTSVTCSGSTTCTAFTAIGAAPITISSTGGVGGGLGWASSTEPNTESIYSTATSNVGIGTTTPRYKLQVSSSTTPQVALTDESLTSPHWTMRNAGGNLYFATSSPATFATSTTADLAINTRGQLVLGNGGTNALPAIRTAGSANNGIYFPNTVQVAISANGTQRGLFSITGLNVTGKVIATGVYQAPDGTVSVPAYSFTSALDSGFYRDALGIKTSIAGVLTTLTAPGVFEIYNTAGFNAVLNPSALTAQRSLFFPDADGTLCVTGVPCGSIMTGWASTTAPNSDSMYSTALSNVGIGTTSPYAKLSVVGEVVATNFTATSTTATSTLSGGVILANKVGGTVMIGTTTVPNTTTLVIANNGTAPYLTTLRNNSGTLSDFVIGAAGITSIRGSALSASLTVNTGQTTLAGIIIKGITAQTADLQQWQNTGGTVLANITAAGRYGIGTSTPNWMMQIASTSASNTMNGQLALTDTGAGTNLKHWLFSSNNGSLFISTSTDAYATSTVAALTINPNTNISISTTTSAAKINVGGIKTASTTTMWGGKWQIDTYDANGNRVCMFIPSGATAPVVRSGACNL